jgi:hypothetical protein
MMKGAKTKNGMKSVLMPIHILIPILGVHPDHKKLEESTYRAYIYPLYL